MTAQHSDKKAQEQTCIDTIRTLSIDAIQRANSGHPGAPMALAPIAFTLYDRFMSHNPANPDWPNRDRFVLSAGHASMLLYGALHVCGYDISLDQIKNFRQLHGICAGHPEFGLAPGVETTTGPLGQGVGNSVGMAIAEKWLAAYFNRPGHEIINYNIFAIASDGCMMEGVSNEAASLAGHLGLDNLIWIYDSNRITIEGGTDLAFSEDVAARFEALDWNVLRLKDANDTDGFSELMQSAIDFKGKPSLIVAESHIGWGSPKKQDTAGAHGEPLGEEEVKATKRAYGWDPEQHFHVPEVVKAYQKSALERGAKTESGWQDKFQAYADAHPELAEQFQMLQGAKLPEGWDADMPTFSADKKGAASRATGGKALNAVAKHVPWLMGGSADLAPSTKTLIDGAESFQKDVYDGRNLHFGIREHAMGAILNGMALSKMRPYAATFLQFADYMRPSIRLAALMNLPTIYVFTHDSIFLGEDGPTHQPVEHLAALRAMPNLDVVRPADANEAAEAWRYTMQVTDRPVALMLTRQNVPTFDRTRYASAEGLRRGGYVLADCDNAPDVILIGTGSEVQLCLGAFETLKNEGVQARVVSMPCVEEFLRQDAEYIENVLPESVTARVVVEAGASQGWHRFTGRSNEMGIIAVDRFGESAPTKDLMPEFGFTVENVIAEARRVLSA